MPYPKLAPALPRRGPFLMKTHVVNLSNALVLLLLAAAAGPLDAQRGIVGKAAPALGVTSWINLPKGKTSVVPDFGS